MTADVNVGGTWKSVNGIFVRQTGSWKEVQKGYVKQAGEWKLFHELAPAAPTKQYLTSGGINGALTNNTFSGVNFGEAAEDRYLLLLAVAGGINNAAPSATIGGVAATRLVSTFIRGSHAGILLAKVPSGASGNVALSWGASVDGMGYSIYRLTGITPTPKAVNSNENNTATAGISFNIAVDAGGILIAGQHVRQDKALSITGVATEDFEGDAGFVGSHYDVASEVVAAAATRTVTATATGVSSGVGHTAVGVSFSAAS